MAISLKKGEGINLSKEVKELQQVTVGLGWSASTSGLTIDCDSFVYVLSEGSVLQQKTGLFTKLFGGDNPLKTHLCIKNASDDIVYYGHLRHSSKCIIHHGDDLVGGAQGDCEQISIDLAKMPENVKGLVVGINIYSAYSKHQDFGKIKNCFGRVVDNGTRKEICRYDLSNDFGGYTAVIVGQFVRKDDGWHFEASGEGRKTHSIQDLAKEFM